MKVKLERELCRGHAMCNARGPEVYDIDDDGYANWDEQDIPAGLEKEALSGLRACPESAITVIDS